MNESPKTSTTTCGGCQCWCDDIRTGAGNEYWKNACLMGNRWLSKQSAASICSQNTQKSAADIGVKSQQIAKRFLDARQPAIFGLTDCDIDSQRWAVAIADRTRCLIDPDLPSTSRAKTLSLQQVGDISATWGEIKNRASVIVYWNCDLDSAPRFRQRYGDLSESCFDLEQRKIFVVGPAKTLETWATESGSAPVTRIECDLSQLAYQLLNQSSCERDAKSNAGKLQEALDQAAYSAVVVGKAATKNNLVAEQMAFENLTQYVASQNNRRRIVLVPWGAGHGNSTGIQSVLTWRTGYPMAVSFAEGYPQYRVPENYWQNVLNDSAADFVLWLGNIHSESQQVVERWKRKQDTNLLVQISTENSLESDLKITCQNRSDSQEPPHRFIVQRPDGVMVPSPMSANNMASILSQLFAQITNLESADRRQITTVTGCTERSKQTPAP